MPYKSKAQARAMHAKANRGEIPKATVAEFDAATDFKRLPARVTYPDNHNPKPSRRKKKAKR